MMETTFTVATPDVIPTLLQFMHEYYEFDHLPFDARVAQTALERMVGDTTLGCIWLIGYAGEPVGYLVVSLVTAWSTVAAPRLSTRCTFGRPIARRESARQR